MLLKEVKPHQPDAQALLGTSLKVLLGCQNQIYNFPLADVFLTQLHDQDINLAVNLELSLQRVEAMLEYSSGAQT